VSLRQRVRRHHLLDAPDDKVRDRALRETQPIADPGDNHLADGRFRNHLRERRRRVLEYHDDGRAGVVELMLEFARGIERIDVDHRHAGAQHPDDGDRVLQDVRHHQRDPVALLQARFFLQPGAEIPRCAVDLGIAQRASHVRKRRARPVIAAGVLKHLLQGADRIRIDVGRHAGRIVFQPESVARIAGSLGIIHCCNAK
jgi:hypothetical protein